MSAVILVGGNLNNPLAPIRSSLEPRQLSKHGVNCSGLQAVLTGCYKAIEERCSITRYVRFCKFRCRRWKIVELHLLIVAG